MSPPHFILYNETDVMDICKVTIAFSDKITTGLLFIEQKMQVYSAPRVGLLAAQS